MAIVRGATAANHPAIPWLMPKDCIINGSKGPADPQMSATELWTRTADVCITNRYRLLFFTW